MRHGLGGGRTLADRRGVVWHAVASYYKGSHMNRKFVQICPLLNHEGSTRLYAVADDGTAWWGKFIRGDIQWEQIPALPEREPYDMRAML